MYSLKMLCFFLGGLETSDVINFDWQLWSRNPNKPHPLFQKSINRSHLEGGGWGGWPKEHQSPSSSDCLYEAIRSSHVLNLNQGQEPNFSQNQKIINLHHDRSCFLKTQTRWLGLKSIGFSQGRKHSASNWAWVRAQNWS